MKWLLIVLLALLLILGVAAANIPASVVPLALNEIESRGLLQQGAPKLYLAKTSGTLWQGQAGEAVLELDGIKLPLGVMNWTLDPWSLLGREPSLNIATQTSKQYVTASVKATEQGLVTLDNVEGRLPISVFEPWMPMLVKGEIAFVLDHVMFNQQELLAIDGILNLEYVDWLGGDRDMPLGSYMAQISLEQKVIQVQLNDFSATLGMEGQLSVRPSSGAYSFDAILQPRADLAPEVAESLTWLGKRQANGDVIIKQRGRF